VSLAMIAMEMELGTNLDLDEVIHDFATSKAGKVDC